MTPALQALYRRAPMGMRFGLEPMREACARAGHPERSLRCVHVAGTNGKGSVCAMVESIARAAKLRTGLYTSPHLCTFAERIRIDGAPISDLERHLARALDLGPELSFFEAATLAAFLAMSDANVDLAILEVGLGGRLDATNVIPTPAAAAITRIAFDHMDLLGQTLEDIAREKAGIAKPGLDLVVGPVPQSCLDAVREVCARAGATLSICDDAEPDVALAGDHQRENARVAIALATRLGIGHDAIRTGLSCVDWPGRLERIDTPRGPVLLDAAHNPDGARALAAELRKLDEFVLVFGALADKAWTEMLDLLAPTSTKRVYALPKGRAPADPSAMAARHAGTVSTDIVSAYDVARDIAGTDLVVVCGSIYLVGELRAHLLGLALDPPVAL